MRTPQAFGFSLGVTAASSVRLHWTDSASRTDAAAELQAAGHFRVLDRERRAATILAKGQRQAGPACGAGPLLYVCRCFEYGSASRACAWLLQAAVLATSNGLDIGR